MNLKGPWDYEWLSGHTPRSEPSTGTPPGSAPAAGGRIKLPAEWRSVFGSSAGTVRFRRRFGRPTNLDPDERVDLVFDGVGGAVRVLLNGQPLGLIRDTDAAARFDVTTLLQPRNEVTVDVAFDPSRHPDKPGGLWAAVALEIRVG